MTRDEIERRRIIEQRRRRRRKKRMIRRLVLCSVFLFMGVVFFGGLWALFGVKPVKLAEVKVPDWVDQELLDVNPYSRPGDELAKVKGIVVHYTANPGTTAMQNRNYFNGLAETKQTSVSSHFIIGIDGEIVQCVPLNEIAYASNNRNSDTISIECCHADETGEFTEETYRSLVRLTAWLSEELHIKNKEIIRHYDVTGKICPKYFVDHEDAWEQFKEDVKDSMQ